jgi:hypothetical protein
MEECFYSWHRVSPGYGLPADSHVAIRQALTSVQAQRRFILGVHTGYDQAQRVDRFSRGRMERQVREIERLRATKPRSAHEELAGKINLLRDRQLVLRRVLDAILFSIIGHELQILRRMTLDNKTHRIDPDVVEITLAEAGRLNRESRYRFNLVSDLTTIVQVGDLIQIDKVLGNRATWRIVELKSGRVNKELKGYLDRGKTALDESALQEIETKIGPARRIPGEANGAPGVQADQVESMAKTDHAIDARTGEMIRTNTQRLYTDHYGPTLEELIKKGATDLAVRTIERCLHFVCLPQERLDAIGGPHAVRHLFYHMMHREASCSFKKKRRTMRSS